MKISLDLQSKSESHLSKDHLLEFNTGIFKDNMLRLSVVDFGVVGFEHLKMNPSLG